MEVKFASYASGTFDESITGAAQAKAFAVPVPENLKGLFKENAKGECTVEHPKIHSLLLKHESIFSRDKNHLHVPVLLITSLILVRLGQLNTTHALVYGIC